MNDGVKAVILGIIIFIGLLFVMPLVMFGLCYLAGWIASLVIGQWLVEGLAFLNIHIAISNIPLIAGCLGWIGGFFKSTKILGSKYND